MTNLIRVMTKQSKRGGVVRPASPTKYQVECTGVSNSGYGGVTVYVDEQGVTKRGSSFTVGDVAEYDSYNLSYTGKIVKITDKCVSIVEPYRNGKTHRLDLDTFCWRNHNFDAAETARQNAETSMYI